MAGFRRHVLDGEGGGQPALKTLWKHRWEPVVKENQASVMLIVLLNGDRRSIHVNYRHAAGEQISQPAAFVAITGSHKCLVCSYVDTRVGTKPFCSSSDVHI